MAKDSLTRGEIEGVRLLADAFVVRDLMKNVLDKYPQYPCLSNDLEAYLMEKAPKLFIAETELRKQIHIVRKDWIKLIEEEWNDVK